ncbi:Crp/Fnr family transcriptional regulator [Bizionia saleffrena]|uniref:Crp/Fnr family transcriptional regulator n=1 Tax=Bizionia saleffrena TaxID=291189 RepID=A0A8H2LBQ3_9FLAO|nr:Crp/Fnr family transcriptional regulator [Bizionia saleffrena]TYB71788.1 Crp/Fnr family transcriptional regulator [Bizionia saleffrena]
MNSSQNNLVIFLKSVINASELEHHIPDILECFTNLKLQKNEFFVEEGRICKYFCYINTGVLQHSITVLGEEKTTYLGLKNASTSALNSFMNSVPSRKNIKAISDCDLWVITSENFSALLKNNSAFKAFYYKLIEKQIYRIDDYRIDLLTLTPEERYQKLLHNEPNLLQEVPLHYLASFLGISSRQMSRIRKNTR